MNQIDSDKEWRVQQETFMLYLPIVETAGDLVLKVLQKWANETIFEKNGGRLTVTVPTDGSPNARIRTPIDKPYEPHMEIRLSLLIDIYKDALAFPLLSNRIQKDHPVTNLIQQDERFKGAKFTFEEAIPPISDDLIVSPIGMHCVHMARELAKHPDSRITKNELYCRFLLFEFMVAWTFFHELAHCLQQHPVVRQRIGGEGGASDQCEELEAEASPEPDLYGQAREVLADMEGIHHILHYLLRGKRITDVSAYLLHCSTSLMFQRFYNRWEESLAIAAGKHPHPFIRDEFADAAFMNWLHPFFVKTGKFSDAQEAAVATAYYGVCAQLFTGIYRANRIEKYDASKAPSYMALSGPAHKAQRQAYIQTLLEHMRPQFDMIRELHLAPSGPVDLIQTVLTNLGQASDAANVETE